MKKMLTFFISRIARGVIRVYQPKIIGITGSVGKTSTKEAIAAVLGSSIDLRQSEKSFNNELGVPLTILGAEAPGRDIKAWWQLFIKGLRLLKGREAYPKLLILEMGADRVGNIRDLMRLAPVNVGVLTAIGHSHLEYFKTIDNVLKEKYQIFQGLPADGVAILNIDDPIIATLLGKVHTKLITYGFSELADLRAADDKLVNVDGNWGINFKIHYQGNTVPAFLPSAVSRPQVLAALAACAVAVSQGINLLEAAQRLRSHQPPAGRGRLIESRNNCMIIDDTYNASPQSTKEAIKTLMRLGQEMRATATVAVLGDMLELGDYDEAGHKEVGRSAATEGVSQLITVGAKAYNIARGATEAGFPVDQIFSFDRPVDANVFLNKKLKPGSLVLVKGSQGARMEFVVKGLMAHPWQAGELLVRQTSSWLKQS